MPPYINDQVVSLIASATTMPVSLVSDGLSLKASQVYVAPSERHCVLKENQTFSLNQEPKVCFVRPSIDVTMMSLRRQHGLSLTGIIVTGMGRDGADGIRHLKNLGARTWAQAPNTATISAMPLRAIETGCVDEVLTLAQMRSKLMMG
jgi:two-component system chemotaxis response regulator CheB